jgi:hypothetical protein
MRGTINLSFKGGTASGRRRSPLKQVQSSEKVPLVLSLMTAQANGAGSPDELGGQT